MNTTNPKNGPIQSHVSACFGIVIYSVYTQIATAVWPFSKMTSSVSKLVLYMCILNLISLRIFSLGYFQNPMPPVT